MRCIVFSLVLWMVCASGLQMGQFSVSKFEPRDKSEFVDCLVVGSGLSGVSAAFYLDKCGVDVKLAEASEFVGGNVISKTEDGFQWEEGPNSFQPNAVLMRFLKDAGLLDELVLADPSLPRYVFWDGELRALPMRMIDVATFSLLTLSAKVRAGLGLLGFVRRQPPGIEETVKEFAVRHLGEEVFERVVDPFVSGVYAGDPSRLGMRAALKKVHRLEELGRGDGLLAGAFRRVRESAAEKRAAAAENADLPRVPSGSLGSMARGMQRIPQQVHQILMNRVLLSHKLVRVDRQGAEYVCTFAVGGGETKVVRCRALVVTTPAAAASSVLAGPSGLLPSLAPLLDSIHYASVAVAVLAYPNEAFRSPLKGFGHLIPRAAKLRTLGSIWASSLFPGRAPEGFSLLSHFIGGAQDPAAVNLSVPQLVDIAHQDNLRVHLRPDAEQPRILSVKKWLRGIPQYEVGHDARIAAVREAVATQPGLFLGGNYLCGVAIGDCIKYGADVAREVRSYLDSTKQ